MLFKLFGEDDGGFFVLFSVFVHHINRGTGSIDLHPASLHFCKGYSGPWRAYCSCYCEIFVFSLIKICFDVLIFAIEESFDFNLRSFEFGICPVDVRLELLALWVSEDKMVFSQVGHVERYSFLLVPFADH